MSLKVGDVVHFCPFWMKTSNYYGVVSEIIDDKLCRVTYSEEEESWTDEEWQHHLRKLTKLELALK